MQYPCSCLLPFAVVGYSVVPAACLDAAYVTHGIHVLVPYLDGYEIATLCPQIERAVAHIQEFSHLTCIAVGLLLGFLALYLLPVCHDCPFGYSLTEHLEVCSSDFYFDVHALLDQGFYIY